MADVNVRIPAPREPVLNDDGTMNRQWWVFLEDLHNRTGGPVVDKVEAGATAAETAQTAADNANAAAAAAQVAANELQERLTFDFNFDL